MRGVLAERLRSYARYRRLLDTGSALDQESVERALRQLHRGDGGDRVRSVTERAVLAAVARSAQPSTAAEVAAAVGMSRATAQRYLSSLVDEGAVEVALRYSSTGRPEHQYAARAGGRRR